ncbi:MAG: type II secretion system GspH family protein [Desulfomicrobium escambiense]|nr:type II secretion system GspH family protein [Desulfomicrobium escambiense]
MIKKYKIRGIAMLEENNKGFTLAEVLITPVILGIVAVYTIPTIQKAYEKQFIVTRLQKSVSTFNSALKQLSTDKGCVNDLHCTGVFTIGSRTLDQQAKDVGDELVKYFNVSKNCSNTTNMNCFASSYNRGFNGSGSILTDYNSSNDDYKFITSDGVSYMIALYNFCNLDYSNNKTGHLKQTCGALYIDINGPDKGPNYWGRDMFCLWITNGKGATYILWVGKMIALVSGI